MPEWVEHPELVEFYSSQRNGPDDLYRSEAHFLPDLARDASTVLDVGCGAGGFADIWRHFDPELRYTGVDASASLIEAARDLHPGAEFVVADGAEPLPFETGAFDVVAALGWLHLEPRYRIALRELWRVTGHRLFFDVRLQEAHGEDVIGSQRLALLGDWDGRTTIPYIAAAWPAFGRELRSLGPARIAAYGYAGAPAGTVRDVEVPVTFATFVLERGTPGEPQIEGDLPLDWPA